MITKAIIIGASTTGKTTLLRYLIDNSKLQVSESDDKLVALNGGIFPKDYNFKLNVLVPKMVNDVLQKSKIIFFTNVDYFSPQNLVISRKKGFRIIQLIITREEMERRNKYRVEYEGYEDLYLHFDRMEEYQKDIFNRKLVDKIIIANKSIELVAKELTDYISS